MRKYEVIEDNGGGLTLVVFNKNGKVDNPVTDWDGNEDNPQAVYDNIVSFEYGWEIVADNDGMYPDKMGCAACFEFGIKKE